MDSSKYKRVIDYGDTRGQTVINISTMNGNIIGGTSNECKPTAKDFYRDLFIYLESKRVLFNPSAVEQREHRISSVLEMKQTLTASIRGKRLTDIELQPIREMLDACNNYLDKVGTSDGHDFIILAVQGCEWFDNSPNGALGSMRIKFRSAIKSVERDYAIKYGKEIR